MSARDKTGLGYGTQLNEMSNNSETDSEISLSVFDVRTSDEESIPANDRFSKADGYHVVPPPITGNFLTPRADISFAGLDEYAIRKKIIESKTTDLNTKTSETVGKTNEANTQKPKTVYESVNRDKVIIEDWNSDDEDDVSEEQTVSSVKTNETQTVKTRVDKNGQTSQKQGIGFKKLKACFVCKSTDHLIKDCTFHDKQRVLTRTCLITPIKQNKKRAVHTVSTARPVSTTRPVSTVRPFAPKIAQTGGAIRPIYPRMDNVKVGLDPNGTYWIIVSKDRGAFMLKQDEQSIESVTGSCSGGYTGSSTRQALKKKRSKITSQKRAAQTTSFNKLSTGRSSVSTATMPYVSVASTPIDATVGAVAEFQQYGTPSLIIQTRGKIQKDSSAQQALVSYISKQNRTNHKDHQNCLLAYFLSQEEPKNISQALQDESWVEAMQEELLQFQNYKSLDFCPSKHTPIESNKPLVKDEDVEDVDVHIQVHSPSHLNAVKRIFRYLKHQPKLGLWYPRDSPFELEAYSDSDYGGASLDRKSTTGGCQFLGRRLISWQCKKQTIMANSTTEAEYVATANCCGQVLWIQNQMMDYGFNFMNTKIHIDNESTISVIKNPVAHSRTKHIEIRFHFIRDCYEKRLIEVIKIHTDHNVADLLTKGFDVTRFNFLVCSHEKKGGRISVEGDEIFGVKGERTQGVTDKLNDMKVDESKVSDTSVVRDFVDMFRKTCR
ncbi:hypothetical protein Tco_0800185 [Tanacetum coccineum]|uniref:Uncharacterized protein n=1 Tax=Tanacetum coccineum TaxID=301880 RepID=A0ABQ4ZVN8_9ASTR